MFWNRFLLTTCYFFIFAFSGITQNYDFNQCKIMESEALKGAQRFNLKSVPQTAFYDVNYYRLELNINPKIRFIQGKITTYFTPLDSGLSQLVFDLSQLLTVDSVIYRDTVVAFNRQISNAVSILTPGPLPQNQLDSVSIYYRGIPSTGSGFGSFSNRANSVGDTILWTLSEPYGASDWWPCKNSITDKADSVEIIVTTPQPNKVASNGLLLAVDSIGTNVRYHWKTTYPIATYLVAVSIGNYQLFEEKIPIRNDSILMQHFLFQNEPFLLSSNGIAEFLQFFDSLFGEYPFIKEKYGHASFPLTGGGMEHQTMSFMANYSGELKAHELAHQWFGNKITCGSWKDLWLNEGFATYLNILTYEFNVVHDRAFYQIVLNATKNSALNHPNGSVYRPDTANVRNLFNNRVYAKGAYSLHMLRWTIGDSAFFDAVRNYLNDSNLVYGFAFTSDLKRHMELSANRNLDEFFDDWIFGKGFPLYNTTWTQSGSNFAITILQTPSDTSVSFFNIPLPFRLVGPAIDTTVILNPVFSGQTFNLSIPQNIQQVEFDPENWILSRSNLITSIVPISSLEESIELFPNPAKNVLYLKLPDAQKLTKVSLFSADGKLIFELKQQKTEINISGLQNGIYFIQLEHENGIVNKKIIKQ